MKNVKVLVRQKIKPKLDAQIEKAKEQLKLPEQFLGTCTLKEGTWAVVLFYQAIAAIFVSCLICLLILKPTETEKYWEQKFKDDFDPYIFGENMDVINTLYPLWRPVTYALIGMESSYFLTGILAMYALCNKNSHPACYLPWLVFTGLLVTCNYLTAITMVVYGFIIYQYRPVTVTWDMVPVLLCFLYAGMWSYGFAVGIAHYRRRCIVKFWRDQELRQKKEGM